MKMKIFQKIIHKNTPYMPICLLCVRNNHIFNLDVITWGHTLKGD